jgi:UDP-N-acetylglucosamine 2-epimerase
MILDKVYNTLKEHDRTLTKVGFTEQYLGKSKSYLYVMKHRQQDISNDSLCKLWVGLKQTAQQLKENGFTSHTYQANERLADMVLEELENKVLQQNL